MAQVHHAGDHAKGTTPTNEGRAPGNAMKLVGDDVQTVTMRGRGHRVAEQGPEDLLAALTAFLAPYRDGAAGVPGPRAEKEVTA